MAVTVRRSIAVQVIVTEQFKQELRDELQEAIGVTRRRIEEIDIQGRRFLADLQRSDITQAMQARRQIEAEKRRQEALLEDLRRQLEEAEKLEPGSEFPRGTLEGLVELSPGNDLLRKLAGAQIVVKDGVIVEVRET